MLQNDFLNILNKVASGEIDPQKALSYFATAPFENLVCGLNLDHHRALRTGLGEVIFAEGKSLPDLLAAVEHLASQQDTEPANNNKTVGLDPALPAQHLGPKKILVSRTSSTQGVALKTKFPKGEYFEQAKLFSLGAPLTLLPPWKPEGEVIIVTAGAADLSVGLEALGAAQFFGLNPGFITDVGVAGIHRLLPYLEPLGRAKLIIAIAGMEGALPSVLAGLFPAPVLGVPTSIGYGVSKGGFAALTGMLSSCASGLSVMNIDNGFGAAAFAAKFMGASPRKIKSIQQNKPNT